MSFPTVLSPACSQRCGDLAFGRGNANARTGDKLSNSLKTFRERTPRMTPNRLLAAGLFCRQNTNLYKSFSVAQSAFSSNQLKSPFSFNFPITS